MKTRQLVATAMVAVMTCNISPGQDWYREDPATAPPARRFHGMGFLTGRATTVLFGGVDERSGATFGDTWEFDGRSWQQRATGGPGARQRFAASVDRGRGTFVVFGGIGADGRLLGDTWQWNGTSWSAITTLHAPAPRADAAMAFDEARSRLVLFGGRPADHSQQLGDTWEFDGSDWTQRSPGTAPGARFGHAMTFDPARGVTMLFGGFVGGASGTSADTWEYDGINWRAVATATVPAGSVFPSLTYHRGHGVAVLTGGVGAASQALQTFAFDGVDWGPGPTAPRELVGRQAHATAYDEVREAVVLFGGASIALGGARPHDDTWELSTQAAFAAFGQGCATSAGRLELTAPGLPEIGRDFNLAVGPLPAQSTPMLLLGVSDQSWAGIPLPLDLTPLGMPGCALAVSIDAIAAMIPLGQTAHAILPIPLDRGLLGQQLLVQVAVLGNQSATSNAGRLRLGN